MTQADTTIPDPTTKKSRPNVVIMYADDLGFGDVGCFGSTDIATPHLDALAEAGARFGNWYSNSPVCSPSRAALLTGLYPVRAGVTEILGGARGTAGLPAQPTLASELKDSGYSTAIFGKWHLGTGDGHRPASFGFQDHFGFLAGCVDYYSHIFYWGNNAPVHDLWQNDDEVWDNGRYLTDLLGERAAEFIEERGDEPYLCYVPFNAPHYPMHAPAKYIDRFPDLPPERRIMAAMISAMDDAVGAIVAAVQKSSRSEETLIFFSSDNGPSRESRNWLNGEEVSYHGGSTGGLRGAKGSLFEGGIRVPTIMSWPTVITPGSTINEIGAMMDLMPTILTAAGIDALPGRDGQVPNWATPDQGDPEERSFFWEYGPQLAMRKGSWKLIRSPREMLGGPFVFTQALFDLTTDEAETTDLSAYHPEVAAQMGQELDAWAQSIEWDPTPWL